MIKLTIPTDLIVNISLDENSILLNRLLGLGAVINNEESNENFLVYEDKAGLIHKTLTFNTLFYLASINVSISSYEVIFKLTKEQFESEVPSEIPNREIYEYSGEYPDIVSTFIRNKTWGEILNDNYTYTVKNNIYYFFNNINGNVLSNIDVYSIKNKGFEVISINQYKEETYEPIDTIRPL